MAIKDQYDTRTCAPRPVADAQYANDRPPGRLRPSWRSCGRGRDHPRQGEPGEYAVDGARSSFGRHVLQSLRHRARAGMSSAGSGNAVAANLVTADAKRTVARPLARRRQQHVGPGRRPRAVSTDGRMGAGPLHAVGPMCPHRCGYGEILDAIAGYDPKDEYTALRSAVRRRRRIRQALLPARSAGLRNRPRA
jgi:hypothetical protein